MVGDAFGYGIGYAGATYPYVFSITAAAGTGGGYAWGNHYYAADPISPRPAPLLIRATKPHTLQCDVADRTAERPPRRAPERPATRPAWTASVRMFRAVARDRRPARERTPLQ